jgi:O-antigen ligase
MTPQIALIVFALGILGLFLLDGGKGRGSLALWIPVIWLSIAGSRMISQWLGAIGLAGFDATIDTPEQLLEGSPFDRWLLTGLVALGLIVLVLRSGEVKRLLRANAPILLFFLYCGVSTLWSDFTGVAFKRWIKALGDLVMILIVVTDPDGFAATRRLLARVGFLLLPLSILLIKYFPELGRGYEMYTWTPVFTGVTVGKNLLGMICMIFGIGAAWRLLQIFKDWKYSRALGPSLAHVTLLAMALWLFSIASSMTSLSCFLLAVGAMVVTSFRGVIRRPWLIHPLVVAIICVAASTLFLDLGSGVLETMGRDPTLTGRTDVWKLVLNFAGNPIWGTGFESFWLGPRLQKIWDVYWWHPNEAHNGYLEVFLNLGWIGVMMFAAVLATGYRNIYRSFQRNPEFGRLKLAYFIIAVVGNFTEAAMKTMHPIWILFLLAVIAVPHDNVEAETDGVTEHLDASDEVTEHFDPSEEEERVPSWETA